MWPHRALLLSATCLSLATASPASSSASSSAVSSAAVSASGSSAAASAGTASVSAAAGSPESVSTRASASAASSGSSASAAASGASASASAASAPADYDYSAPVDYGDYGDYGPSKPSLSFAIFEDTEARPPEETKAAQPSQCTWGVVNCCGNPDARHSRIACFEKLGCNGAWFDDLCTPLVKRGVFKEVFGAIQG